MMDSDKECTRVMISIFHGECLHDLWIARSQGRYWCYRRYGAKRRDRGTRPYGSDWTNRPKRCDWCKG